MDMETSRSGYIAKILLPVGSKDIPLQKVGQKVYIHSMKQLWCHVLCHVCQRVSIVSLFRCCVSLWKMNQILLPSKTTNHQLETHLNLQHLSSPLRLRQLHLHHPHSLPLLLHPNQRRRLRGECLLALMRGLLLLNRALVCRWIPLWVVHMQFIRACHVYCKLGSFHC